MSNEKTEIRGQLKLIGNVLSVFTGKTQTREQIEKMNRTYRKVSEGIWLSTKTVMKQEFIRRNDGSILRICIVTKKGAKPENATGLLWIHGGGYATGLPEQCTVFADRLVDENTVMILPDYRLSVEAPYPAALDDCYLTLLWMIVCAKRLGIREDQIFAGGESAGGGLCAALCMYARDIGEVNIAFQMPLYPMMDDRPTPSNTGNTSPVWNSEKNDAAWAMYKGGSEADSYCAAARETDYSSLPPAFSITGSADPLRDETVAYMKHLYEADIPVMYKVYKGCYHAFDMVAPLSSAAKKAAKLETEAFRHAQKYFFREQPGVLYEEKDMPQSSEPENQ